MYMRVLNYIKYALLNYDLFIFSKCGYVNLNANMDGKEIFSNFLNATKKLLRFHLTREQKFIHRKIFKKEYPQRKDFPQKKNNLEKV